MYWHVDTCRAVLRLQAGAVHDGAGFSLRRLRRPVTVLQHVDGLQHVLIAAGTGHLQLAISGADVLRPVQLTLDAVHDRSCFPAVLATLERLNRLTADLPDARPRAIPAVAKRMVSVLRVLDARRAGATYRDIATVLFGHARVRAEWADPQGYLRDHLRRAARRSNQLVDGGYRRLLC